MRFAILPAVSAVGMAAIICAKTKLRIDTNLVRCVTHHMCESTCEYQELYQESPHEGTSSMDCACIGSVVVHALEEQVMSERSSRRGILSAHNRIIPAEKDQCTHDDSVRDLRHNVTEHEYLPGVCFAGTFSSFV